MSNSQSHQQSKPDPKPEAVTSLVLGITSVLAAVSALIRAFDIFPTWWEPIESISGFYDYWGWLFAIVGIVLGIMGLKSVKNKLAIAGLVLSVTSLVPYIYFLFLLMSPY